MQASRAVTLKGVSYEVAEASVGQFIATMNEAEKLEKRIAEGVASGKKESEVLTSQQQLLMWINACKVALPTCPMDQLESLTFEQLRVLIGFLNGADDASTTTGNSEAEPKKS